MKLFEGTPPKHIGVHAGRLASTPTSPNAVSSQAADVRHRIAPLSYHTEREQAMAALIKIIEATPRTRIVTRNAEYLYTEYRSALLGFVDDVEFYFEPGTKLIHIRSASRLGYSDFGVNRARIEDIRRKLLVSGA
jgi:uncharacterized protein (DUF1499 family)